LKARIEQEIMEINEVQAFSEQALFLVKVSGKGTPLILIPGLMSNGSVFDELAAALAVHYQVHVISVKGFAGTPKGEKFSLQQFCDDLATYIESAKLEKPSLVGHSMGGLTALKLACEHENLINKVISIDGVPFIGPIFTHNNAITVDLLKAQAQQLRMLFSTMHGEQLAMQSQQSIFIQASSLQDQARIVEMARTSDPTTAGNAMFDLLQTDLRPALSETNTPILMLGASGAFMQSSHHKQIATLYKAQFEHVKNARVTMHPKARHFMMFDDLEWLTLQIEGFLEE